MPQPPAPAPSAAPAEPGHPDQGSGRLPGADCGCVRTCWHRFGAGEDAGEDEYAA